MSDNAESHNTVEIKINEDVNDTSISVKVHSTSGTLVFRLNTHSSLSKLKTAYAAKVGKDVNSIRFIFDGHAINNNDTPASLGMEDGDTIEAVFK